MVPLGHRQAGPDSPCMGWVLLEQTESGSGSSNSPYTKVGNEEVGTSRLLELRMADDATVRVDKRHHMDSERLDRIGLGILGQVEVVET